MNRHDVITGLQENHYYHGNQAWQIKLHLVAYQVVGVALSNFIIKFCTKRHLAEE